ncbi:hypothetical protein BCR34DRAFT_320103 [Clohesyomyces aquaticus]|uniref:Uncharacterized protein n=1 Tax=Clohesyomyces aquaticus TaxID=1231657 RepID=A0A1Y2A887_9PLEO|nr:hypothetical protein BCR34DRAFT_320103 [Clohesyomyces aquaticus]
MSSPIHYLSNLRTSLTILVILQHTSIPYGGLGHWIYVPATAPLRPSLALLVFTTLNQTFFMAAFFLLSGYFTARSLSVRRERGGGGGWKVLQGKVKRLGVPTVLYSVVGDSGVRGLVAGLRGGWETGWKEWVRGIRECRGVRGPVWYCALLLVLDAVYIAGWEYWGRKRGVAKKGDGEMESRTDEGYPPPPPERKTATVPLAQSSHGPSRTLSLSLLLLTSTLAFLLRTHYPVGTHFRPLNLQPSYLPQYLLFYSTGFLVASQSQSPSQPLSLSTLLPSRSPAWSTLLLVWTLTTGLGLAQVHSAISSSTSTTAGFVTLLPLFKGGLNRFCFIYSLWNEFTGVLITSSLLHLYHTSRVLNCRWGIGGFELARYSYAAFLVHGFVVVGVQFGLDWYEGRWWGALGAVGKTVVAGGLGVWGSWVAGWGLVRGVEWYGGRGYV